MACIITSGVDNASCSVYSVGGNNKIWLFNTAQVEKVMYGTIGEVTEIVMKETAPASGVFYKPFQAKSGKESINGKSPLVIAGPNKYFNHSVSFTLTGVTQEKIKFFTELGLSTVFALEESKVASLVPNFTTENRYYFIGGINGMEMTAGDIDLGLAVGDGQTIPITIEGANTDPMAEVRLEYNATRLAFVLPVTPGEYPSFANWIDRLEDTTNA